MAVDQPFAQMHDRGLKQKLGTELKSEQPLLKSTRAISRKQKGIHKFQLWSSENHPVILPFGTTDTVASFCHLRQFISNGMNYYFYRRIITDFALRWASNNTPTNVIRSFVASLHRELPGAFHIKNAEHWNGNTNRHICLAYKCYSRWRVVAPVYTYLTGIRKKKKN